MKKTELKGNLKRISESQLITEILKFYANGESNKGNILEQLGTKYAIQRQRFYKIANNTYNEWSKTKHNAENEVLIESTKEALKSGLKSKLEKQLHIQNQIDSIQADIDRGILEDYVVVGGKLQVVNKIMNAESKAYLRKTMQVLYAELNKMEGDYTPIKIAETDSKGNDKENNKVIIQVVGSDEFIKEEE